MSEHKSRRQRYASLEQRPPKLTAQSAVLRGLPRHTRHSLRGRTVSSADRRKLPRASLEWLPLSACTRRFKGTKPCGAADHPTLALRRPQTCTILNDLLPLRVGNVCHVPGTPLPSPTQEAFSLPDSLRVNHTYSHVSPPRQSPFPADRWTGCPSPRKTL